MTYLLRACSRVKWAAGRSTTRNPCEPRDCTPECRRRLRSSQAPEASRGDTSRQLLKPHAPAIRGLGALAALEGLGFLGVGDEDPHARLGGDLLAGKASCLDLSGPAPSAVPPRRRVNLAWRVLGPIEGEISQILQVARPRDEPRRRLNAGRAEDLLPSIHPIVTQ